MPRKSKKQTRRGNGEGSIYKSKDRWCGQVTTGYDEHGKQIRKTFYGKTREEVTRKVTEAANQLFNGQLPTDESPLRGTVTPSTASVLTIEKMLLDFLWTFKKPAVSDTTFEWYLNLTKSYIVPTLGTTPVNELTSYKIQMVFNHMHDEKRLSVKTIKEVRGTLNQAFTHAVEMKIATTNPVLGSKVPKESRIQTEARENEKVIPVNTRAEILKAAENYPLMKTVLTTLMFTGIRIGECLALTWGHIDFPNNIINIDSAITKVCEYNEDGERTHRKTVIGGTKTICSERKIRVSKTVIEVLSYWQKMLPNLMRPSAKYDLASPNSFVFPNHLGSMRTYSGFRAIYQRFMSKYNLGNYSLHSYRHTFATMLLEQGVNPKVVQKLLGHKDIETTLGTYSHVLSEVFDGVAGIVGKLHTDMTPQPDTNAPSLDC